MRPASSPQARPWVVASTIHSSNARAMRVAEYHRPYEDMPLTFPALTPIGWAALAYTIVVGMTICYLTWFATLRYLPPAMASTGMLLVPLIGVISAALIFDEPLGWREATSMVLTLGGVTLALKKS
jgi:drug/metabolite transporter (DMT)-like permease